MTTATWLAGQRRIFWCVLIFAFSTVGVGFSQDTESVTGSNGEQETAELGEVAENGTASEDESTEATKTEAQPEAKSETEAPSPSSSLSERVVGPANLEPHASRVRAVRAIRFSIFVSAVLLAMLTTVSLMRVNRLTHGRYAGRLWWSGLLLIPGGLLVGAVWAWNNDLWKAWMDGPLL
ncbi:MAG: hypothetical protein JNL67_03070 [Planctomycetaceae bacterium]|nr:hypothetical protein [Planctomycetaceae bacterium]